ncbi:uncharacterized protein LOC135215111 [Macrobrachium nipponense]|uniref:uncharacterized protein LOC135215111 n=1 Tax=Macrobrachium nipponense TaxID=159736 RepID=UPI0030C8CBDE
MEKSFSPEPNNFEFVFPDDCITRTEDDWCLVDVSSPEFPGRGSPHPGHGTPPPSPPDSCKVTEEDDLLLSYVSVLREGDREEIQNGWSSDDRSVVLGSPVIFEEAQDDPTNPTAEVVGLTKDSTDTRDDHLNLTVEVVGLRKDIIRFKPDHFAEWDESSFYGERTVDNSSVFDNRLDIYVTGRYKKGKKCDLLGNRFRKKHRTKERVNWTYPFIQRYFDPC